MESGDRVLDIGCGIGRMAIPLMDVLTGGSYEGFDTSKTMIRWCDRNLSSRRPDFHFTYAPIYNRKYNPFGTIDARDYKFPYPDDEFDFAFATSVFTHLGIEDSTRYLSELSRVLKPGGTALVTCFLLGGSGRPSRTDGLPFNFRYEFGPLRSTDADEPEAAVAFPEDLLLELVESTGLEVDRPISYGRWPEIDRGPDVQDSIVIRKPVGA